MDAISQVDRGRSCPSGMGTQEAATLLGLSDAKRNLEKIAGKSG
jgi:hypothetical protein